MPVCRVVAEGKEEGMEKPKAKQKEEKKSHDRSICTAQHNDTPFAFLRVLLVPSLKGYGLQRQKLPQQHPSNGSTHAEYD